MRRVMVFSVLFVACASNLEPGEPVWGKEPCAHCMMLVSERAPSAQVLLEGGMREYFDDVGCMVLHVEREGVTPKAWWVRVGDSWVRAEQARYAREHTPMDFGFVGATGRASGCHLHFEAWTAPGWQSGGRPINPLAMLRSWAAAS